MAEADSALCHRAAVAASQTHGVPLAILTAISEVETGRAGPTGRAPWPWTLNHAGVGDWYPTRAEALAALEGHLAKGDRRVDVGCFQINHRAHGDAFRSARDVIDPARNADYAARFLSALQAETGSWATTIGYYHSRTPRFAEVYRAKVLARPIMDGLALSPPSPPRPTRTRASPNPALKTQQARLAKLYARFRSQAEAR